MDIVGHCFFAGICTLPVVFYRQEYWGYGCFNKHSCCRVMYYGRILAFEKGSVYTQHILGDIMRFGRILAGI